MKICQNCGAQIPVEAQFCPVCGAAQKTEKEVAEITPEATPAIEKAAIEVRPTDDETSSEISTATSETPNDSSKAAKMAGVSESGELIGATDSSELPVETKLTEEKRAPATEATPPLQAASTVTFAGDSSVTTTTAELAEIPSDEKLSESAATVELKEGEPTSEISTNSTKDTEQTATAATTESTEPRNQGQSDTATELDDQPATEAVANAKEMSSEEAATPIWGSFEYLKGYLRYLKEHIKEPRLNQKSQQPGFAAASLVIVILTNTLVLSGSATAALQRILAQLDLFGLHYVYEGPGLVFFFEILLALIAGFAITFGAYYVAATRIYQRPLTWWQAVEELMAPASLVVCTSLVSVLLAPVFVRVPAVGLMAVIINLFLMLVSFVGNLWHTPNLSGRANRYYTAGVTMLVVLLLLILVGRIFVAGVLPDLPIRQQLPTGYEDFFNQNNAPFY